MEEGWIWQGQQAGRKQEGRNKFETSADCRQVGRQARKEDGGKKRRRAGKAAPAGREARRQTGRAGSESGTKKGGRDVRPQSNQ
jgi:hypothetical protein